MCYFFLNSSVKNGDVDLEGNAQQGESRKWFYTCAKALSHANSCRVAVISAKNHKRQRRKRQSVIAKREKSQTPKVLTAILTLPNLT